MKATREGQNELLLMLNDDVCLDARVREVVRRAEESFVSEEVGAFVGVRRES